MRNWRSAFAGDWRKYSHEKSDAGIRHTPEAIKMCPLVNELKSRKEIETVVALPDSTGRCWIRYWRLLMWFRTMTFLS